MSLIVTTTSGVTAGFGFTDTMRTPPTRTVSKSSAPPSAAGRGSRGDHSRPSAASLGAVSLPPRDVVEFVTAVATIIAAIGTLGLAFVTYRLVRVTQKRGEAAREQGGVLKSQANATEKLAASAIEQSQVLRERAEATRALAETAAKQLEEFRAEMRVAVTPLLRWELVDEQVQTQPFATDSELRYLIVHCRIRNYGPPAILRPTIDILENSLSLNVDPRNATPPSLLPTGESFEVALPLGPTTLRSYPNQHLKVKIEARPYRLIDEWRAVTCDVRLWQRGDRGYVAELRSESGWQP